MAAAESRFYRTYRGQLIAVSQKVARELRDFYGFRGEISIIPHGVDSTRFTTSTWEHERASTRNELGLSNVQTVALYVGDLTKAHQCLRRISKAAPELQLVIVSHSTRYRWRSPNARFVSPTKNIVRYYAAADAFLFPTTYDSFGMVVLEAMASGLPVFTSDQAGVAELIQPGRDGFVFPLSGWVDATRELVRDRNYLDRVGRSAARAARRHSWTKVMRRVEDLYFNAAAKKRVA
jgi:UDP-glucose:(heptosyl)LPS alpha-1,3-glucosyltransferase